MDEKVNPKLIFRLSFKKFYEILDIQKGIKTNMKTVNPVP